MAEVIDIVGLRFGKLTVVEPSTERHKSGSKLYICKCDCGSTTLCRSDYLRNGRKKSCGCSYSVGILDDLTGMRFGSITVISRAPNSQKNHTQARWNCVCDCGTTMVVYGGHLKRGEKTSCGCQTMTGIAGRKNAYENSFGKIPDGYAITTLDNNVHNYAPSNLYAIDREALRIYYNKRGWKHICDPELKLLALKTAELELEIQRAERKLQAL